MKQPELGTRISELRNQNSMTQKELAELCNVDIRTIQRIESGEVVPRMYTIKLLSTALGFDVSSFNNNDESRSRAINRQIKLSFIAAVIFSINAIPVVFYLVYKSLNPYVHVFSIMVHISTCIFFFRGFYLLSKKYNNAVMAASSMLAMILLPLINLMELAKIYLLKPYYRPGIGIESIVFTLLCINAIVFGISLLIEAYKRKEHNKINLYSIAGVITIIQSSLFLSLNLTIVAVGLMISIGCNVIMSVILYKEYKGWENGYNDSGRKQVLAW